MATAIQNEMIRQFNHLAPSRVDYAGQRFTRTKTTMLVNNTDTVRFQFAARKRPGQYMGAALGIEVVFNDDDTYSIVVTCWRPELGTEIEIVCFWSHVGWEVFEDIARLIAYAERQSTEGCVAL